MNRRWVLVLAAAAIVLGSKSAAEAAVCHTPMPMDEAIRVGHEFAQTWRPVVELLRVDTAHPPQEWEESRVPPGLDGGRCVWNFEVKDPRTHQFMIFRVANGVVMDVSLDAGTDTGRGFPPATFRVSGKCLAEKARLAGIMPAKPPGTAGYSYYLRSRGHGRYEVEVIGADAVGRPAGIRVDPTTGKVLSGKDAQSIRP